MTEGARIRALIAEWRAEVNERGGSGCGCYGKNEMQRKCADDLESLLSREDAPQTPEVLPDRVALHLSCLPANLREVKRGLEHGMFGPPVPLRSPGSQQWVNAAMALTTVENAIEAAEYLQRIVATQEGSPQ